MAKYVNTMANMTHVNITAIDDIIMFEDVVKTSITKYNI